LESPTPNPAPGGSRPRLLLIAPKSPPPHLTGGLDIAVMDVAAQLQRRGWKIDMPFAAAEDEFREHPQAGTSNALHLPVTLRTPTLLGRLRRSPLLSSIRLPRFLRGYFSLFVERSTLRKINQNLFTVEGILKRSPAPDAVLLFTGYATPGICALVLEMYPAAVLASLAELAYELKLSRAWALMRYICRLRLPQQVHPYLYRAATPEQLRCVAFASQAWREDAVQYGLNPSTAHIIYFGVPMSAMSERPTPRGRLLWVGRMTPDKGLHHFVRAMPAIRRALPEARLTAVARRDDHAYEAALAEEIAGLRLGDALKIASSVERAGLQSAYAEHDMLLCISPFSEPVPLVMMEAFMAGLPVVITRPRAPSLLVLEGETCLCFDPDDPRTLVQAILRLHDDAELRRSIAAKARKLVEEHFSLDQMGARYDALLRRSRLGS